VHSKLGRVGLGCASRPSRSRKATFCDLNHRCRRDAGLFSLARKAMLDRDAPDAFPLLALARIRSCRSSGAVNRRRVYSVACVGHLNRRLEWQRHDFSPGKLQTMRTSHARGCGDYFDRLRVSLTLSVLAAGRPIALLSMPRTKPLRWT